MAHEGLMNYVLVMEKPIGKEKLVGFGQSPQKGRNSDVKGRLLDIHV